MAVKLENLEIVKSGASKKISDYLHKSTEAYLSEILKKKLRSNNTNFHNCIHDHLQKILNWSSEVIFEGLQKTKSISQTYVDLDILLTPKKYQHHKNESLKKIKIKQLFEDITHNVVILGQPGAGKTTSLKKICNEVLFPQEFQNSKFSYVILIIVNELSGNHNYSIFRNIFSTFNIEIENFNDDYEIIIKTVLKILNEQPVLLIIDGLDEIYSARAKQSLFDELNKLSLGLTESRFIATIRSGDFNANINLTRVFEICPLTTPQILEFTGKWFETKEQSTNFINELKNKSYSDLLERPIFLALLCSLFERAGNLPDKPIDVYHKAIYMLLEDWNQQWGVTRETKYSQLITGEKFRFLSNLAYHLTVVKNTLFFNRNQISEFYKKVEEKFKLPSTEGYLLINELESHHGIFIQDGYDMFRFYHKSMQEYLTAHYFNGFPSIPENVNMLLLIPNELAICIALANSTEYFIDLILRRLKKQITVEFIFPFLSRLQLEKPNFDINPYFALALIFLNTILKNENLNKNLASNKTEFFLTSKEFKKSLHELQRSGKNFKLLTTTKGVNVYNYYGQNDFRFLYKEILRLETIYC